MLNRKPPCENFGGSANEVLAATMVAMRTQRIMERLTLSA
jgi:hypothetical protein